MTMDRIDADPAALEAFAQLLRDYDKGLERVRREYDAMVSDLKQSWWDSDYDDFVKKWYSSEGDLYYYRERIEKFYEYLERKAAAIRRAKAEAF